jgi:hypothetical protein
MAYKLTQGKSNLKCERKKQLGRSTAIALMMTWASSSIWHRILWEGWRTMRSETLNPVFSLAPLSLLEPESYSIRCICPRIYTVVCSLSFTSCSCLWGLL